MKKYVCFILIVLLSSSCETNWGKYGGYRLDWSDRDKTEYFIILDKGEDVDNTAPLEVLKQKSIPVKFHNSYKVDTVYLNKGNYVIPSFVLKYNVAFDDNFILVDQKPIDSIFGRIIRNPYPRRRSEPSVEALDRSNFHMYWIIKKVTDDVYGPLNKEEYYAERKKLGIPETLQIKINP